MVRTAREPNPTTPQLLRVSTSSATSSRRSSGSGDPSPSQRLFVKTAPSFKSPFSSANSHGNGISPPRRRAVLGERQENIISMSPQQLSTVEAKLKSTPKPSLTPKAKHRATTGSPARDLSGLSRFIAKSPQVTLPQSSRFNIPSSSPDDHSASFSYDRPGSTPYAPRLSMPLRSNEDDTLLLNMAPPGMGSSSPPFVMTDDSDAEVEVEAETSRAGARMAGGLMTPANSQEVSFGSPSRTQTIRKSVPTASMMRNSVSRLPTPPSSQTDHPAAPIPPTPQVASSSRSSRLRARPSPTPPRRVSKQPPAELNMGDITAEWDTPLKLGEDVSPNPRKKKSPRLSQPGGTPTRVRLSSTPQDCVEIELPQRRSVTPTLDQAETPTTVKAKSKGKGRASRTPSIGLSHPTGTRTSSGGSRKSSGGSTVPARTSTPGPSHIRTIPATAPASRRKSTGHNTSKRSRTTTPSDFAARSQAKSRRETTSGVVGLKTPASRARARKSVGMTPRDQALSGRKLGMLPKPIHGSPGDDPLLLKPYYEPTRKGPKIRDGAGLGLSGVSSLESSERHLAVESTSADKVPESSPFRFSGAEDMTLLPLGASSGDMGYFDPGPAWSDDGSDAEGGAGEDTFIHVKQRQQDRSRGQIAQTSGLQDTIEEEDDTIMKGDGETGTETDIHREQSPFAPPRNISRPQSPVIDNMADVEHRSVQQNEEPSSITAAQEPSDIEHQVASVPITTLEPQVHFLSPAPVAELDNTVDIPDEEVKAAADGDITLDMEGGQWDTSEPDSAQHDVHEQTAEISLRNPSIHGQEASIEQLPADAASAPAVEAVSTQDIVESVKDQEVSIDPSLDEPVMVSQERFQEDEEEQEEDQEALVGDVTQDGEDANWDLSNDYVDIAENAHAEEEVRAGSPSQSKATSHHSEEFDGSRKVQEHDETVQISQGDEIETQPEGANDAVELDDDNSSVREDDRGDVTVEIEDGACNDSVEEEEEECDYQSEQPSHGGSTQIDQQSETVRESTPSHTAFGSEDQVSSGSEDELDLNEGEDVERSALEGLGGDDHEVVAQTTEIIDKADVQIIVQSNEDDKDDAQSGIATEELEATGSPGAYSASRAVRSPGMSSPRQSPAMSPIKTDRSPVPSSTRFTPSLSPMPITGSYRTTTPAFSPPSGRLLQYDDPSPALGSAPTVAARSPFVLIKHRGDLTLAPTPRIALLDRSSRSPAPALPNSLSLSFGYAAYHAEKPGSGIHAGEESEEKDSFLEEADRTLRRLSALRSLSPPTLPVSLSPFGSESDLAQIDVSQQGRVDLQESPIIREEDYGRDETKEAVGLVPATNKQIPGRDNSADSPRTNETHGTPTPPSDAIELLEAENKETVGVDADGNEDEHEDVTPDGSMSGDLTIEAETSAWDMSTEDIAGPLLDDRTDSESVIGDDQQTSARSQDQDDDDANASGSEGETEEETSTGHTGGHDTAKDSIVEQEARNQEDHEEAETEEHDQAEEDEEDDEVSPPPAEVPEKIILRLVESGIIKLEPASDDEVEHEEEDREGSNAERPQQSTTPSQSPAPAPTTAQMQRDTRQRTPGTPEGRHLAAYKRMLSASPRPRTTTPSQSAKTSVPSTTPRFAPSTPTSRAPVSQSTTPAYSPPARSTDQAAQLAQTQTQVSVDESGDKTARETGPEIAKRMLSQRVRGKASRLSQAFIPASEPSSPVPSASSYQAEQVAHHSATAHQQLEEEVERGSEAEEESDDDAAGDTSVIVRKPRRSLQDELLAAATSTASASHDAADDGEEMGNESFRSVVEVSSLDPKAAARAAAILKLNHAYIEHGVLSRSKKAGASTGTGTGQSSLSSVRKSTSRSEAEKRELLHEAELEIVDSYRRSQTRSPSRGPRESPRFGSGFRGRSMSVMSFMTEDYPVPGGYITTPKANKLAARPQGHPHPQSQSQSLSSSRKRQRPSSYTDTDINERAALTVTEASGRTAAVDEREKRWGVPEWKELEKVYRTEKGDWIKERDVKPLPGGLVAWARRSTFGMSTSSSADNKVKEWDSERVVEKVLAENKGWDREMLVLRVQAIERRVNQIQEDKTKSSKSKSQSMSASDALATPASKRPRSNPAPLTSSSTIPSTPLGRAAKSSGNVDQFVPPSTIRRVLNFVWGGGKSSASQTPAAALMDSVSSSGPASNSMTDNMGSSSGSGSGLMGRLEKARNIQAKGSEQQPLLPTIATGSRAAMMKEIGPTATPSSLLGNSIAPAASSASASAPPKSASRSAAPVVLAPSAVPSTIATTTTAPVTTTQSRTEPQPQPYKRLYPTLDPPMTQRSSAIAKLFPESASNPSLFSSASTSSSSRSDSRRSLESSNFSSVGSASSDLGGVGVGTSSVRRSGSSGSVKDLVQSWEGKKESLSSSGGRSVSGR
ncbi:hypothetical protein IAU59_005378 [Kwoniella sp. CBS 9459]